MMEGEDAIERAPVVIEEKDSSSSTGKGAQDGESNLLGSDVDGQVVEAPELKRKLKARHLQMIAIGMPRPFLFDLLLIQYRWYYRDGSLHRQRWSNCQVRASRSTHRICLCRNDCILSDEFLGRIGNIHHHLWSLHFLCCTIR